MYCFSSTLLDISLFVHLVKIYPGGQNDINGVFQWFSFYLHEAEGLLQTEKAEIEGAKAKIFLNFFL